MRNRLPGWVLLFYLALDLTNPFVPGAFQFTPEEGLVWVEGMPHSREGAPVRTSEVRRSDPVLSVSALGSAPAASAERVRLWHLTAWLASVRTGDPPAHDFPPPDSEDHWATSESLALTGTRGAVSHSANMALDLKTGPMEGIDG